MTTSWNGFGGGVQWVIQPRICPVCTNRNNLVIQRDKIVELLEAARKLTHPDVCSHSKADEVTAKINVALDEFTLKD